MASAQAERYLASLPPEDQQAIRAGGDVDAWYNAAVAAGAVPQNFGGTAGVSKPWWEMSAQEAGINPWQQDYKQEFATMTPQRLAQMSPEQRARWSMEHLDALDYRSRQSAFDQWMAWQDSFDPSCPPNAPYRAGDGSGCVEKPDNSNAGYQQGAQDGSGGVSGGAGKGSGGQQSLTSPLIDMLKNQGSFLGGYDPIRGDDKPGLRGGVVGGGGLWWAPAEPEMSTTESMPPPTGTTIPSGPGGEIIDPLAPRGTRSTTPGAPGGIMGGQGVPRSGGTSTSGLGLGQLTGPWGQRGGSGGIVKPPMGPYSGQGSTPAPGLGGLTGPWGQIGGSGGIVKPPMGPYSGQGGPLTNVMAGLQGQGKPFNPLGSVLSPFQKRGRNAGSWFGG